MEVGRTSSPKNQAAQPEVRHIAPGPMAGFEWQKMRALEIALGLENADDEISIEAFDDVAVLRDGHVVVAAQFKHSFNDTSISVNSIELWRTLRAWIPLAFDGTTSFLLSSTANVHATSSLRVLTEDAPEERLVDTLAVELDEIAGGPADERFAPCYAMWNGLDQPARRSLLRRIRIQPAQPRLTQTLDSILTRIHAKGNLGQRARRIRTELVGWFVEQVAEGLALKGFRMRASRIWQQLEDIRDGILPDVLISTHQAEIDPATQALLADPPTYVRQLLLIDAGTDEIFEAVQNVFRSGLDRDDWLQNRQTAIDKLNRHQDDLVSHWRLVRGRVLRDPVTGEPAMRNAGRTIHDQTCMFPGTVGGSEISPSFAHGTYHRLANIPRVGWHPEFEKRLKEAKE